ncbi:MAG TPA: RluA family pseudouridine synthase [Bacteroidia bacterium]|nr:RluA family pseudouridine synthase [Bacteroidia bacterium]HNU32263.1 RluA family pseudouridine synthase [Bacteroidia bacterium]
MQQPQVIFEDYYLLVLNKPYGLQTEADNFGNPSLELWAHQHIQQQHPKKKTVFVGIVHRLDRPVAGIVLIAKTKTALANLNKQFEERKVKKTYEAVVEKKPLKELDTLTHFLKKDVKFKKALISERPKKDFVKCSLTYHSQKINKDKSALLEIELHTGRYHQIRAQLAFIDCPIVGDVLYGAKTKSNENKIELAATALSFTHPFSNKPMEVRL